MVNRPVITRGTTTRDSGLHTSVGPSEKTRWLLDTITCPTAPVLSHVVEATDGCSVNSQADGEHPHSVDRSITRGGAEATGRSVTVGP